MNVSYYLSLFLAILTCPIMKYNKILRSDIMKLTITTVENIEVDVEKLKELGDFSIEDIFKYGKSANMKTNFLIDGNGDVAFDNGIEKKILEVLWREKL
jgi:hypothetical protein